MSGEELRPEARDAKRLVVKIGSGVLTANGDVRSRVFSSVAREVAQLVAEGRQVVLVSSGAVAFGARTLGWDHPGRSIPEKQAAAAVGQIGLVALWGRRFRRHDREVAQVLVTRGGLQERERFLNARHTLTKLLALGIVPIVNENDTVATDEIRFGDNDNLSATVVDLIGADLLVILTDVDGLYREPPAPGRRNRRFQVVDRIGSEVRKAAGGSESAFGRGGMITKLEAASSAARAGAATILCNGLRGGTLARAAAGEDVGTLFRAGSRLAGRKHWLAFTARPKGQLVCDEGAVKALRDRGRSLLPSGVTQVEGRFGIGDPVTCIDDEGREFARGLAAYGAEDVERIRGLKAREIGRVLGFSNGDEVIHRDDLVLLAEES
jgi:glutamate 5-kinase